MSEDVYKDTHDNLKESEFKLNNKTWNVANLALKKTSNIWSPNK